MKIRTLMIFLALSMLAENLGKSWVFLVDKGGQDISILGEEMPQRNIHRRQVCGIEGFSQRDLPVSVDYIDQIEQTGADILGHSRWLNAVVIADEDLPLLEHLTIVESIKPVLIFRRELPDIVPEPLLSIAETEYDLSYGASETQLSMLGVPAVHAYGYNGEGVLACYMDTGFRLTHQVFNETDIVGTYDFVGDDSIVSYQDGDPSNTESHGTSCFSVASGAFPGMHYGPAYGASFLLARTEDVSGESIIEEHNWVMGIEWAESLGAEIVSTSLGYNDWYTCEDMNGDSAITTIAADYAASVGVLVVNANGNSGPSECSIAAPADGDSVLSIGAMSSGGDIAGFSSRGPTYDGRIKPDLCAMGLATRCARSYGDMEFGSSSGTSLSTPLVSGIAILLKQVFPHLTPMEMIDILKSTADNRHTPDNTYGWGLPNIDWAIRTDGDSLALFPLKEGWNMISNPFRESIEVSLFPSLLGAAWSFNPMTRAYDEIADLEPGMGCFIMCTRDTNLILSGALSDSVTVVMHPGWNMVGGPGIVADSTQYTTVPEGAYYFEEIYSYDTRVGEYETEKTFVPGESRWFMATETSTITVRR